MMADTFAAGDLTALAVPDQQGLSHRHPARYFGWFCHLYSPSTAPTCLVAWRYSLRLTAPDPTRSPPTPPRRQQLLVSNVRILILQA